MGCSERCGCDLATLMGTRADSWRRQVHEGPPGPLGTGQCRAVQSGRDHHRQRVLGRLHVSWRESLAAAREADCPFAPQSVVGYRHWTVLENTCRRRQHASVGPARARLDAMSAKLTRPSFQLARVLHPQLQVRLCVHARLDGPPVGLPERQDDQDLHRPHEPKVRRQVVMFEAHWSLT